MRIDIGNDREQRIGMGKQKESAWENRRNRHGKTEGIGMTACDTEEHKISARCQLIEI